MPPIAIAHRTLARTHAENSLAGIRACLRLELDGVEMDVRSTADGALVLLHDETLDRTTDGVGPVADTTWPALREMRCGRERGTSPDDEPVATLRAALSLAAARLRVYLDVRAAPSDDVFVHICEARPARDVLVWLPPDQRAALPSPPGEHVRLVCDPEDWRVCAARAGGAARISLELPAARLDSPELSAARSAGVEVGCVTLREHDAPHSWRRAAQRGCDWIMTDRPEELRRFIRGWIGE